MLKLIGFIISVFLIVIIFLHATRKRGFSKFCNKSDLLGSPSSAQRSLNILTTFGILIYFGIAVQLNLINV
jgi:preprotein translocase subunit SecG